VSRRYDRPRAPGEGVDQDHAERGGHGAEHLGHVHALRHLHAITVLGPRRRGYRAMAPTALGVVLQMLHRGPFGRRHGGGDPR
jgi:hypothetical protein